MLLSNRFDQGTLTVLGLFFFTTGDREKGFFFFFLESTKNCRRQRALRISSGELKKLRQKWTPIAHTLESLARAHESSSWYFFFWLERLVVIK